MEKGTSRGISRCPCCDQINGESKSEFMGEPYMKASSTDRAMEKTGSAALGLLVILV